MESWLESFIYYFHFALLSSRFEYFTICRLVLGVGNRKKWSLTGNLFTSIEDRISVQIYSIKNVLLTIGDAKGNDSM